MFSFFTFPAPTLPQSEVVFYILLVDCIINCKMLPHLSVCQLQNIRQFMFTELSDFWSVVFPCYYHFYPLNNKQKPLLEERRFHAGNGHSSRRFSGTATCYIIFKSKSPRSLYDNFVYWPPVSMGYATVIWSYKILQCGHVIFKTMGLNRTFNIALIQSIKHISLLQAADKITYEFYIYNECYDARYPC